MTHPAGPAPTDEAVALSPEWLTSALSTRYADATVTAIEVRERLHTSAVKVRFGVTYAEARPELPDALCIKGFFTDDWRGRPGLTSEPVFYRDVGDTLGVRIPPCEYAAVDDQAGHGVIIMRDLKVTASARFGEPSETLTPEQSAGVLDQIAQLHTATWGRSEASLPPEFKPSLPWLTTIVPPDDLQKLLSDGRCDGIPAEVASGARLHAAMHAMAALTDEPRCLVHGDLHAGNVYYLPDGSTGLIDWQVAQLGSWALDVAYHLATALDPEVRARSERDLLDHYLERLAAGGVDAPGREDAWRSYRAHFAYGFFMWGITQRTPRVYIEKFTHRLARAVTEHDSFGLLGV
jgi:thiamine kinase-like enzyme